MRRLSEQEIQAGFALLDLETEEQRSQFDRFRSFESLDTENDFTSAAPASQGNENAELA